jgi:hypothetical protein
MVQLADIRYDIVWTAAAVLNVVLVVLALRRLIATDRLDGLVKFVLALFALFLPFIGPGLVLLLIAAPRGVSAPPAG